jgi:hypothetical protein
MDKERRLRNEILMQVKTLQMIVAPVEDEDEVEEEDEEEEEEDECEK